MEPYQGHVPNRSPVSTSAKRQRRRERKEAHLNKVQQLLRQQRLETTASVPTWPTDEQARRLAADAVALAHPENNQVDNAIMHRNLSMWKPYNGKAWLARQVPGFLNIAAFISRGAYGQVFIVKHGWQAVVQALAQWGTQRTWSRSVTRPARQGGTAAAELSADIQRLPAVVLKIQSLDEKVRFYQAINEERFARHVAAARILTHAGKLRGRDCFTKTLFGATVNTGEPIMRTVSPCRFTVMGYISEPITLRQYMKTQLPYTAQDYVLLERAVMTMWLSGVLHCDLHYDNVLLSYQHEFVEKHKYVYRPYIIDFGYAIPFPEHMRSQVLQAWNADWNSTRLDFMVAEAEALVKDRKAGEGFDEINWDVKLLKAVRDHYHITAADIHAARQQLYQARHTSNTAINMVKNNKDNGT